MGLYGVWISLIIVISRFIGDREVVGKNSRPSTVEVEV